MRSTMQDFPLTIGTILRHASDVHGDGQVVTATAEATRAETYAEVGVRAARLANALRSLGVSGDDRVATFQWNNAEHLEGYLAVPAMGAVLHTLNIRLFPEQLTYIANHAEDKVVVVDDSLVGLLARHLPTFETVEHVLVAGPDAASADLDALRASGKQVHLYDEVLAAAEATYPWPSLDERDASAMCYTSGTTGNPKGVVYSHRSSYLHSMAVGLGIVGGLTWTDRVLPIVPMFHANSWGLAYAAVMTGASLAMPDRWLQAEPLCRFMRDARAHRLRGGADRLERHALLSRLSTRTSSCPRHLRLVLCGGSAVPVSLQKALGERHGITMVQAWGMTETSPVGSVAGPPLGPWARTQWRYRGCQGRLLPGVEGRIVGESGQESSRATARPSGSSRSAAPG